MLLIYSLLFVTFPFWPCEPQITSLLYYLWMDKSWTPPNKDLLYHLHINSRKKITISTKISISMKRKIFDLQYFQIVRKEDDSMSNISKSMPSLLVTHCASYPINSQTASNIVHYIYCHFLMFSIEIV